MVNNRHCDEYWFVAYFYIFLLLKPIISIVPQYSTIILLISVVLMLILKLLTSTVIIQKNFILFLAITLFFGVSLLWGKLVNHYSAVDQYIINFVIYGVIPLFIMSGKMDYSKVLAFISRFSLIATVVIFADPFMEYQFTGGYMEYGFNMLTYSFAGIILNYYYFEKKWCRWLILVDLVLITIYGNKGAVVAALILFFVASNLKERMIVKKFVVYVAAFGGIIFWKQILSAFVSVADKYVKGSYSINTIKILLSDTSMITNSRTNIWEKAVDVIKSNPLGVGVGYFENCYNGYTHNVELDIGVMFGIIGLILFILLLIMAVRKIVLIDDRPRQVFLIGSLICWFVPMQFSLTIWNVIVFWIFWGSTFFVSIGSIQPSNIDEQL